MKHGAGLITRPAIQYYAAKMVAIERSKFDKGASIFVGLPALIPDSILPVEVGIEGGPTEPQQHLILQAITKRIDSSHVSDKL